MQLTVEEKQLLKEIINNQYAVGPFSGMIFNALVTTNKPIDELVKQALMTRLRLKELQK